MPPSVQLNISQSKQACVVISAFDICHGHKTQETNTINYCPGSTGRRILCAPNGLSGAHLKDIRFKYLRYLRGRNVLKLDWLLAQYIPQECNQVKFVLSQFSY